MSLGLLLLFAGALAPLVPSARAQSSPSNEFQILDNSFLVEEAFNQEAGIYQNILSFLRHDEEWELAFTQEWPVVSQRHQVSYTLAFGDAGRGSGLGDILINYRLQALMEGPGQPAFSPRLSLIVPSGDAALGLGDGSVGLQANLPFSKRTGSVYWHWNAGFTWIPSAETGFGGGNASEASLMSPMVSGSAIWGFRPMLNLMLEVVVENEESLVSPRTTARDTHVTLSPGLRGGWNLGDRQLILGAAVPILFDGDASAALFGYLSYELPFRSP